MKSVRMNRMLKLLGIVSISFVLILVTVGGALAQEQKVIDVQIWGGSPGGAKEAYTIAVGELIRKAIPNTVVTSQLIAGMSAFALIEEDEGSDSVHIGYGSAYNAGLQYRGRLPFEKPWEKVRVLFGLTPSVTYIVTRAADGIESIEGLKGNRHSPGTVGMTGELFFQHVLEEYGMSYDDLRIQHLTTAQSTEELIDGKLDSLSVNGGFPRAGFVHLAETMDVKFLPLREDVIDNLVEKYPGTVRFTIPAGTYKGVDLDIKTTATINVLHTTADLPDEIAYKITKVIFENWDYLSEVSADMRDVSHEDMTRDLGIPFHPGAVKFFEEKGLM
ncbi:MAG: TAXI family TRAP transporter solute-binding subunit [Bacillota bacterium]|nr:TAXI family TRAP transporter solute-binding subunit [Bacillota bacterium]